MSITSITYTGTDIVGTDAISDWVATNITVATAGTGPTAAYTAYSVTSIAGGTAYISRDRTAANTSYFLDIWLKASSVSAARGYIRTGGVNYADSSSVLYGSGSPSAVSGIGIIASLDNGWTLWRVVVPTIPAGTASIRIGPGTLFTTTATDSVILGPVRCAPQSENPGWTIKTGTSTLNRGLLDGVIGKPLRGRL